MRLITWNVNRRLSVLAEQAAALAGRVEGVVVHTAHVPDTANGWIKPLEADLSWDCHQSGIQDSPHEGCAGASCAARWQSGWHGRT